MNAESKLPSDAQLRKEAQPVAALRQKAKRRDFFRAYFWISTLLGIGGGVWAVSVHKVLNGEQTILLSLATADVALLAVIFAAVALMGSFLRGSYGHVLKTAVSLSNFFFPFMLVAVVAAAGTLVSFAGAMNSGSGTEAWRAAIFGLAVGLTTWTVAGTVWLTSIFVEYAVDEREAADDEKEQVAQEAAERAETGPQPQGDPGGTRQAASRKSERGAPDPPTQ
jgi:hypothetical protein